MRIFLVGLIILVAGASYGQVPTWTEKDVDRLYGDQGFISLVDDWAEFYNLASERARSKYENEGAGHLSNEIRAFKDQLFIERPNITGAEIHKEVKAFIENAPYAPDLLEREIRLSELVWTRITNRSLVSNVQLRFPMFTSDQIQNMVSGKVSERKRKDYSKIK